MTIEAFLWRMFPFSLAEKFYDGVCLATKSMLDTTSGGNMMTSKTPKECMDLFENLVMSNYQGGHDTIDFPMGRAEEEDGFVGNPNHQNIDFGNSYNSDWRNHPGFSWRNGNHQGEKRLTLEEMTQQSLLLTQSMERDEARHQENQMKFQKHITMIQGQGARLLNMKRNIGELAKQLQVRQAGGLPTRTESNPMSHVKAVTTRSGRGRATKTSGVADDEPVDEEIEMESAPGKVHQARRSPASTT
ncbi:hypothetical protein L1987_09196 [Smallanthus sonchifolius]|uniref:Uncharacterized protein n=1 Tax=Smallanthus sonchifolius TaxID=185202 RepID=A0ACB9JNA2_9ASTR|nr:hypothetical protein L1987_09196 [Smallanthus sonchifolius]